MSANHNHDRRPEAWTGATLPDLQVEHNAERGTYWLTQQQGLQDPVGVEVHPDQILYLGQRMGLVRELTGSEAVARERLESQVRELERDRLRLRLALLAARDRIESLYEDLCTQNGRGHEDLGVEVAKSAALADILDLACADFEGEFGVVGPSDSKRVYPPTTAQQDAKARKTPVFPPKDPQISHETPPKLGALSRTKPPAPGLFEGDTHEG